MVLQRAYLKNSLACLETEWFSPVFQFSVQVLEWLAFSAFSMKIPLLFEGVSWVYCLQNRMVRNAMCYLNQN